MKLPSLRLLCSLCSCSNQSCREWANESFHSRDTCGLSAMERSDSSLVVVWQAEFWRRATRETYWMDFPREVSKVLEAHRNQPGLKFVYRLREKSLTEVPDAPEIPEAEPKRARCEEEDKPDNFVYWICPDGMIQVNTVHGCRRRLRRVLIEQEELDRVSKWP